MSIPRCSGYCEAIGEPVKIERYTVEEAHAVGDIDGVVRDVSARDEAHQAE